MGNRNAGPTGSETYSHDAANRLLSGGQGSYAYDERGNQTIRSVTDGSWALAWNGENQLVRAEKSGTVITFKYDPFGRRVEKNTVDATVTTTHTYVYDGEDIAFEYVATSTGTTVNHFVHGPGIDEPLALERNGQSFFYHADGLGSIVALTDAGQNIVQSYSYEAFGLTTASGSFEQPYGFTGREFDTETGLYFYRARYYDPAEGRFFGVDPLSFGAGDANLFRYVGNNPVMFTDPRGEIIPVLAIWGYTTAAHAVSATIVWATMEITAWAMDDPEVPGTVGGYKMSDLSDDMAIASFGAGTAGTLATTAISGGFNMTAAAPSMCQTGMAAIGTERGQYILDRASTLVSGRFGPGSQPSNLWESIGLFWGIYDDYKKINK